ncbi:hypothetical protein XENTR_v10003426 [Xenopus tropicalis]|nr:hypothetical protein XENTR_v10003426 [Xenopus tropicalis]
MGGPHTDTIISSPGKEYTHRNTINNIKVVLPLLVTGDIAAAMTWGDNPRPHPYNTAVFSTLVSVPVTALALSHLTKGRAVPGSSLQTVPAQGRALYCPFIQCPRGRRHKAEPMAWHHLSTWRRAKASGIVPMCDISANLSIRWAGSRAIWAQLFGGNGGRGGAVMQVIYSLELFILMAFTYKGVTKPVALLSSCTLTASSSVPLVE